MDTGLQRRFQALPPFVQKASVSFGLRFGGLAIQFGISILITRLLGAERFGAYIYAFVWASMVGTVASFGLPRLSVRELPRFLHRKDASAVLGFLAVLFGTIGLSGLIAGLVFATLQYQNILVLAPGWFLVVSVAVTHALILSLSEVLNGFQIILRPQFYETIFRQIIYVFLIGIILVIGRKIAPDNLFIVYFLSAIPTLFILSILLRKAYHSNLPPRKDLADNSPLKATPWLWFGASLPLLLSTFAGFFNSNIDILMIGGTLGNFETGIYRAAVRGALLVEIANAVSIQILGPMLSKALAQGDDTEAQKFLSYGAAVSFFTGITLCILLAVGGMLFLGLFGPEFTTALTSMRLLLIGQAATVLAGGASILLILMHKEKTVLGVTILGLCINIVLNLMLIGPLGINGAAIATAVSAAVVNLLFVIIIFRQGRFDPTMVAAVRLFAARNK